MEHLNGRTEMMLRTALPGLVLGTLGLIAGIVAIATGETMLGSIAGVLALGAGVIGLVPARRLHEQDAAQALLEEELRARRSQAGPKEDLGPEADEATASPGGPRPHPEPTIGSSDDEQMIEGPSASSETSLDALVDQETGLFSEDFYRVALDSRIAAARRHLRPVALVLLEVVKGLPANDPTTVDAGLVAETIKTTLREADTACRLRNGFFALLLEDTPENGAIWTVERIRRQLLEIQEGMTVWAGVACYPAHAFSPDKLQEAAELALTLAREWRQDRIEVAAATD